MSRQKKNQKVGTVQHRSGAVIDLMLNPNNLAFSAEVMEGVSFGGATAQEVRVAVLKYLDDNSRFEWAPVIEIEEKTPFASHDHAFIGIEIDRYYLAKDARGCVRKLLWDDFETDGMANRPATDLSRVRASKEFYRMKEIQLPWRSGRGEGQCYAISYSDGAWTALNQIREALAHLKSQLRSLLEDDQGIAKLAAFGERALRLLPSAEDQS